MEIHEFVRRMPKVELHVHLEGSIRPETLLDLASRHGEPLPARTVEELREWYRFRDFDHFIEIYLAAARCLRTPEDIERITLDFLDGQAAQNVVHSEVTYTASTQLQVSGIPLDEQLAAINSARDAALCRHGVTMTLTIDYPRNLDPAGFVPIAEWAAGNRDRGISALGLGGPEKDYPPELFVDAFAVAHEAGLPSAPHAGETAGADSIRGALRTLNAERIGHGIRCLEDPELVAELRERQIPLEVCPTSNVCLGVVPSFEEHPLARLREAGLYVTLNSDDPPMFDTTVTDEYVKASIEFGLGYGDLRDLVLAAAHATFLEPQARSDLENRVREGFYLPEGPDS